MDAITVVIGDATANLFEAFIDSREGCHSSPSIKTAMNGTLLCRVSICAYSLILTLALHCNR